MKNKTFKVEYNDFGICHVIAPSFERAFEIFSHNFSNMENLSIKSISMVGETTSPIVDDITK